MRPGNSMETPSTTRIPTTAQTSPNAPSVLPTSTRKPKHLLSNVFSSLPEITVNIRTVERAASRRHRPLDRPALYVHLAGKSLVTATVPVPHEARPPPAAPRVSLAFRIRSTRLTSVTSRLSAAATRNPARPTGLMPANVSQRAWRTTAVHDGQDPLWRRYQREPEQGDRRSQRGPALGPIGGNLGRHRQPPSA